jgi:hypothetical protein
MPTGGVALAGVASKYEGPSILVYGERQRYNEWEFIFDLKDNRLGSVQGGSTTPDPRQRNQQNNLNNVPNGPPPPPPPPPPRGRQ